MKKHTNVPEARYVDLTPTWVGVLPLLLAAAAGGSKTALRELQTMARHADSLRDYVAGEARNLKLPQEGEVSR